jgi:hypothetical protein
MTTFEERFVLHTRDIGAYDEGGVTVRLLRSGAVEIWRLGEHIEVAPEHLADLIVALTDLSREHVPEEQP